MPWNASQSFFGHGQNTEFKMAIMQGCHFEFSISVMFLLNGAVGFKGGQFGFFKVYLVVIKGAVFEIEVLCVLSGSS